jgi:membrane protein insertase Oxa1/YidC/SpoIIIJ
MSKPEKTPLDVVHQNAIHVETIQKEQRTQKLYTEFNINPYKKRECMALFIMYLSECPIKTTRN